MSVCAVEGLSADWWRDCRQDIVSATVRVYTVSAGTDTEHQHCKPGNIPAQDLQDKLNLLTEQTPITAS